MARKKASFEEDAFLEQIVENPDDDAPRLIYADWLEERGDPRGAFIRLQCQLGNVSRLQPELKKLRAQESELLLKHGSEWKHPIMNYVDEAHFNRGFIEGIQLSAIKLLKHAAKLFRSFPTIRRLQISKMQDFLPDVANSPWMEKIVDFTVLKTELGGRSLQALTQSPCCARLERLTLYSCGLNQASIACLADAPSLRKLKSLNLVYNDVGAEGARIIARSADLSNIRDLSLSSNHIEDSGVVALANESQFRLEYLDLGFNLLGNDAVAAIAQCSKFSSLKTLRLNHNQISNVGVKALAGSPYLNQLEFLTLTFNRISDQGLKILASSTTLENLVHLLVSSNEFSRNAAKEFRATKNFRRIQTLEA